jgi:hypothetical protein
MSTPSDAPSHVSSAPSSAPSDASERRIGWLLAAAGLTALVTLALVLLFGLAEPPPLAAVGAATQPEYGVALLSYRDGERGQCLHVIDPDGAVREVRCALDGVGPLVGWDTSGIVVLRYGPLGEQLDAIDPETGVVASRTPADVRLLERGTWGGMVDVERVGGRLIVRDAQRTVVWDVEAPDAYWISASARHPETGEVVLLDTAGRLLLLPAGSDVPLVWVEDVDVQYGELIWQGTPVGSD